MFTTRSFLASAMALLASTSLFQSVAAQVTTDCQPLNRTDCPPDPAFGLDYNFNFNATPTGWETTVGPVTYDGINGANFVINKQGDSPTIRSKFYIFFGRVEVIMKAAAGTGIISSVMFLSDTLDEIDWEFMGGNHTHAETNYFGKGEPDFHNAIYYPVNGGIIDDWHNYTTHWTKDALDFYIDGQLVRTLLPKDANNTHFYPQTPMRVSLGIWAGGDPTLPPGTREWAGGDTDYKQGPFTMQVKSTHITDFSSGKEYVYGDQTGSWESIRIVSGNSTVKEEVTAEPVVHKSLADKWNELPQTAQTAVYASSAGVGAILFAFMAFYCIKQRRRGAREARIAEAKWNDEQRELAAFKAAGINPDALQVTGSEYNAKDMARVGITEKDSYSVPSSPVQGAAVVGGVGAPLLSQSPRITSPGPQDTSYNRNMYNSSPATHTNAFNAPNNSAAAPLMNRVGSPNPSMHPSQQFASQQPSRSFTAPGAQMRAGSPGPQQGFGAPLPRNPNPMMAPQPQRSFTANGGYSAPSDQYWGNNNSNNYR